MPKYEINVRAIVAVSAPDENASGQIEGWDQYDWETIERDGDGVATEAQIRCDQIVAVDATDAEAAVEEAKIVATPISVDGWVIDDVTLWVDDGIDIVFVGEAEEASSFTS